jgi:hypothetical protein
MSHERKFEVDETQSLLISYRILRVFTFARTFGRLESPPFFLKLVFSSSGEDGRCSKTTGLFLRTTVKHIYVLSLTSIDPSTTTLESELNSEVENHLSRCRQDSKAKG